MVKPARASCHARAGFPWGSARVNQRSTDERIRDRRVPVGTRAPLRRGGLVRERDEARFETGFVAARRVHVAKLGLRPDGAAAAADRDERAVAALAPGAQL